MLSGSGWVLLVFQEGCVPVAWKAYINTYSADGVEGDQPQGVSLQRNRKGQKADWKKGIGPVQGNGQYNKIENHGRDQDIKSVKFHFYPPL